MLSLERLAWVRPTLESRVSQTSGGRVKPTHFDQKVKISQPIHEALKCRQGDHLQKVTLKLCWGLYVGLGVNALFKTLLTLGRGRPIRGLSHMGAGRENSQSATGEDV